MKPTQDLLSPKRKLIQKSLDTQATKLVPRSRDKQVPRPRLQLRRPSRQAEKQCDARSTLRRTTKPTALRGRNHNQLLTSRDASDHIPCFGARLILAVQKQTHWHLLFHCRVEQVIIASAHQHDGHRPTLYRRSHVQRYDLAGLTLGHRDDRRGASLGGRGDQFNLLAAQRREYIRSKSDQRDAALDCPRIVLRIKRYELRIDWNRAGSLWPPQRDCANRVPAGDNPDFTRKELRKREALKCRRYARRPHLSRYPVRGL